MRGRQGLKLHRRRSTQCSSPCLSDSAASTPIQVLSGNQIAGVSHAASNQTVLSPILDDRSRLFCGSGARMNVHIVPPHAPSRAVESGT